MTAGRKRHETSTRDLVAATSRGAVRAASASGYQLQLNVLGPQGQVGLSAKYITEGSSANTSGVRSSTIDIMSAFYQAGTASTYTVTMRSGSGMLCTVSGGGSGNVVDANHGDPSAYPPVLVTCS